MFISVHPITSTAMRLAALVTAVLPVALVAGEPRPTSPPLVAASLPAVERPDPNTNAALDWWRAIFMRGVEQPTVVGANEVNMLDVDLSGPDNHALFSRPMRCLDLLAIGAANDYCDWGIDVRHEGYRAPLPYVAEVSRLARLALLRSRWLIAEGQPIAAVDDLLLALRTARLMKGRTPCFVETILSLCLERQVIEVAAAQSSSLPPAARQRFMIGLGKLPVTADLVVAFELDCWRMEIESLLAMPQLQRPSYIHDHRGETLQMSDLTDAVLRPLPAMYQAELKRWEQHMQRPTTELLPLPARWSGNTPPFLVMRILERPLRDVIRSTLLQLRHQEMLLAGLVRLAEGDVGLAAHPDPLTGKPFHCETTNLGFAILADPVDGEKPRRLVFQAAQTETSQSAF